MLFVFVNNFGVKWPCKFSFFWATFNWEKGRKFENVFFSNILSTIVVITLNYLNLQSEIVVGTQIIMNISKCFNSSSKKRDLSNQSCNGEEPKKARKGSLNDSSVSFIR